MGQKVNPVCIRLELTKNWRSRWFVPSKKLYVRYLQEDRRIRDLLKKELASAAVSKIDVERSTDRVRVVIHTARPGILIGRRGENIQRLQEIVQKIIGTDHQLKMDYVEITQPALDAQLIADSLAFQLEKRIAFRRAMKRAIQQAREAGAKGIRVVCDGRLAGSEMTRRESYRDGIVPLGTFRSDIDFGIGTAHTTAGCIGTKAWVCRGDLVPMVRKKVGPRRPRQPNATPPSRPSTS
jgi:small subunit ribosomal protein S3